MPNRRVYRECPYCQQSFSYVEMKIHRARCPQHPLAVDCRFCGVRLYLRKNFQPHIVVCPNMPPIPDGFKLCSYCQNVLPVGVFAIDSRSPDGKHGQCKVCHNTRSIQKRKHPEEKLKHRRSNLRWLYGLTGAGYDAMVAAQGGLCAMCRKPPNGGKKGSYLHVDHSHQTGKIRGLLCQHCNHVIGHSMEDPAILLAGVEYLTQPMPLEKVS